MLGRREVSQGLVEALLVEPGHPAAGGDLEVVEAVPVAAVGGEDDRVADQLSFVEAVDRLGQRVVPGLGDADVLAQRALVTGLVGDGPVRVDPSTGSS